MRNIDTKDVWILQMSKLSTEGWMYVDPWPKRSRMLLYPTMPYWYWCIWNNQRLWNTLNPRDKPTNHRYTVELQFTVMVVIKIRSQNVSSY